jgi:uncharacterized membrane protein YvbJ
MILQRHCPKCGAEVSREATFCSSCGFALGSSQFIRPESMSPQSTPSYQSTRYLSGKYLTYGLISAILSLFIIPEIFGSAAIIFGAYSWKNEQNGSNNGLFILVLGIVGMLVGIYFTSYFALIDLITS